jgi:hypothetical protein
MRGIGRGSLEALLTWTLWELSLLLNSVSKGYYLFVGISTSTTEREYLSVSHFFSSELNTLF